ncbi:MAG TPA: TonB-dependent receptor plug domain-containing protein [bacterium]|nr:TonB-dependent receptor plug domain-containing protein [bacterium]
MKKSGVIPVLFALILALPAPARPDHGQITGTVSSAETNEPLPAANVYLKNTHVGCVTDTQGGFTIDQIPAGEYILVADYVGYAEVSRVVKVTEGSSLKLQLKLKPAPYKFNDPITVTATRGVSLASEVPASVNIVNAREMEKRLSVNAAEALQSIQGITIKDYGGLGGVKSISLRGSSSEQVLVLLDGQRINNPQTGQVDLGQIPLEGIKQIEVVRGGNSALYGADAVGGVINLITDDGSHSRPGFSGSVKMTNASFRTWSMETFGKYLYKQWQLQSSVDILSARGDFPFTDNYGLSRTRKNADVLSKDFYFKVVRNFGRIESNRKLDVSFKWYDAERGAPGTIEPYYYHARQWDSNRLLNLLFTSKVFNYLNDLRIQAYHYDNWNRYENDESLTPIRSEFRAKTAGSEIQMESILNTHCSLTYGLGLRLDYMTDYEADTDRQRTNFYLFLLNESTIRFERKWLKSIVFVPSLRYDKNSDYRDNLAPKTGVVINFGENFKTAVKGNIGCSYRAPTFNDLYWPEDAWTKGNSALKPEHGYDWDAGLRLQIPWLNGITLESTFFQNRMVDLIIWAQNDQALWMPENVDQSLIRGVENAFSFKPFHKNWQLSGNYTWLDARNLSGSSLEKDKLLVYRPKHTLNLFSDFSIRAFSVNYQFQFTSRRFADKTNFWNNSLEPYTLSTLGCSYNWNLDHLGLNASLQVRNLFDEEYRTIKNMPMPGREYRCAVKFTLNSPSTN